jgi:hypothetical protein
MDDDARPERRDEPAQGGELNAAQRRSRHDWFAFSLGEEWWSDGDGIYRRNPETHLLNVASPPHDDQASLVSENIGDALAPSTRDRGGEEQAPAADGDAEVPKERRWSRKRR